MALEFRLMDIARNKQNYAEQPNRFYYKDFIKFDKRVKQAFTMMNGISLNSRSGISSLNVKVLPMIDPNDPTVVIGTITGNTAPVDTESKEPIIFDMQYVLIVEVED
ncbi:hypothetical protein P4409_05055 [Bacillus thuringiensis]|uniref:hypothetical protein n=1 Tax=Bacillus cereus group TaxID=86661 RepID=UPI0002796749|nr:hypothetical protein [Bacillus cereus]EJR08784.1 hypothetical protein II5_01066 [Bacillus cereus MSX-A1]MDR4289743.1 hypothetical protein [Bacillus cereus]MED3326488.1 hypothetical protein [Bacillus thuringiensis]